MKQIMKANKIWHDASEKLPLGVVVVRNCRRLRIGWSNDEGDGIEDEHGRLITKTYQKWAKEDDLLNLQEESVSGLDNGKMPVDRWKEACKAASNQANYRKKNGLTETSDDYFVDGVQWADEHPIKEPVSEDLEEAAEMYAEYDAASAEPEDTNDIESLYSFDAVVYAFKAGAKWKEKQMQGKIMHVDDDSEWEDIDIFMRQNVDGKCKIIIIKDE